jgi:methylenetetrahydrofolate reductase (NADPH)
MSVPRVSFEFFPPQTLDASFRLWETVQALAPLSPNFVSVTYGAGGTTRKLTHEAVAAIGKNYGLNVAAHLTCVDATRAETLEIAEAYAAVGVTEIVALRGDAPKGATRFTPHPDGFAHAADLVSALAAMGKFTLRVGAYPERHPDAADATADIHWLKAKLDAGATSAITQFFFEADTFLLPAARPVSPPRSSPASCRSSRGRAPSALPVAAARMCRCGWTKHSTLPPATGGKSFWH